MVDDEDGIRLTLGTILQREGFDVSLAASVPQALEIMNRSKVDVLLTDLNIGSPADGFILVSAMRRIQPNAATFILTGYPDFQTALEAIRKQADDYFTKPADIPTLVATLRERTRSPRPFSQPPSKQAWDVILENSDYIIQRWLKESGGDQRLNSVRIGEKERIDGLPLLLNHLATALVTGKTELPNEALSAAAAHGAQRARQGYTVPVLCTETRILNRVIGVVLQQNLLSMNLSTLIPEALKISEYLRALLEESIRTFQETEIPPQLSLPRSAGAVRRVRQNRSR